MKLIELKRFRGKPGESCSLFGHSRRGEIIFLVAQSSAAIESNGSIRVCAWFRLAQISAAASVAVSSSWNISVSPFAFCFQRNQFELSATP